MLLLITSNGEWWLSAYVIHGRGPSAAITIGLGGADKNWGLINLPVAVLSVLLISYFNSGSILVINCRSSKWVS